MKIRINSPDVIHESFDSESVIVNLRVGTYFSLNEAGLPLWDQINSGASEQQLCDLWQKTHETSEEQARSLIRAFLQELHEEQLIVLDTSELLAGASEPLPVSMPRPVLQKYTDLQDLLMLDPIHDVDERGWPHSKPVDGAAASA